MVTPQIKSNGIPSNKGEWEMKFINNMRSAFAAEVDTTNKDRGDLVQTVIIVAGFALAGFLLVNFLSTAILNKGADIANCIEGSSGMQKDKDNLKACSGNHAKEKGTSFKDSAGYKDRFKK